MNWNNSENNKYIYILFEKFKKKKHSFIPSLNNMYKVFSYLILSFLAP